MNNCVSLKNISSTLPLCESISIAMSVLMKTWSCCKKWNSKTCLNQTTFSPNVLFVIDRLNLQKIQIVKVQFTQDSGLFPVRFKHISFNMGMGCSWVWIPIIMVRCIQHYVCLWLPTDQWFPPTIKLTAMI